ncbi:MAG TPA: anti-sigma factor [Myxococcota bacterium]
MSHAPNVDCSGLVELLGEYVDDQLPDEVKAAVESHMHMCAPCMAFIRQYRFAPQAVREHLLQKVPVDLENRLLSFLRDRTKR